jgi:uncharacterized phiE125 gp8 family phage protein
MGAAGDLPVSLGEVQAYLRLETGEEEALLAGLLRSATGLCEAFTGRVLIERGFAEMLGATGAWQRLSVTPVRAIESVERIAADGSAVALLPGEYDVDIDSRGDGWVRVPGEGRVRVRGQAGMASEANGVPEPLRQGIVRLTAHLHSNRDGTSGEPPAAVTALWRPYRRMRLA